MMGGGLRPRTGESPRMSDERGPMTGKKSPGWYPDPEEPGEKRHWDGIDGAQGGMTILSARSHLGAQTDWPWSR